MGLTFAAQLAERDVDVRFEVATGETLAVLGPNGAGKSTVLSLLAGLLAPTSGRADLEGSVLFDVGASRRTLTEPRERGISLLAQEALLFPHLSALENVAFGPRSRGVPRTAARATALGWLERVGVAELVHRRPHQLSGGQAQRVALARALAVEPSLLLLDEPLAALDVSITPTMRLLLREVLQGRTAVIVTHDPLDAFLLADRVLVLEGGRIVESGATAEVLTRPVTAFGARLAGLNLVQGRRTRTGFAGGNGIEVPLADRLPEGTALVLAVRPAAISVSLSSHPGADAAVVRAEIDDVEHRGDLVRIHAAGLAADVAPADAVALGLVPGIAVDLRIRHGDATVYPTRREQQDSGRSTAGSGR
ncbi:ABC transporter ATP-binding protein [Arthrobacter echini]|uniref:ABC transporter ATP-binding protein n=1 Tax=Arthrobacter echini TaxID=1529066 RepID=A0A5D0XS95_9MICC|nr:ABC transporter ATP-binding protein [Arthrobacter echini]TYC99534.1 ABC transporter ATP-binding protein [Arthrobacter echini]